MSSDDATIDDGTLLYRRLHPTQLLWDANRGRIRATSSAFKDAHLSVALGDELIAHGFDAIWVLRVDPHHQLGCFSAGFVRLQEQIVWRDPLIGHERYGDDASHGIVEGKKPRSRRNSFVEACDVLTLQPDALAEDLRQHLEPG